MRGEPAVLPHRPPLAEAEQGAAPIKPAALIRLSAPTLGSGPPAAAVPPGAQPLQPRFADLGLADLRAALDGDEFSLAYQPIVSAATRAITGCEALLRWDHPILGPVSPADFVPLAEETGAIGPIGRWVLETACRQAAAWPEHCRVSVNVSPVQLQAPGFAAQVAAALQASGLAARRLELELTEGVPMRDAAVALNGIMAVRALGVSVALDDFGTGFASLSYLQRFVFDRIKIDRSFIRDLGEARESWFLVRTMHDIAHHFGMAVTAEGIETEDEAQLLREFGSRELQGFLFSRPVTSAALTELLAGTAQAPRGREAERQPKSLSHAAP